MKAKDHFCIADITDLTIGDTLEWERDDFEFAIDEAEELREKMEKMIENLTILKESCE